MLSHFRRLTLGLILSLTVILPPGAIGAASSPQAPGAASAYDLIEAVNALRASNGLASYNTNSILMQIAQAQADYLAATGGVYGHIGPGGTRPFQRALSAGYPVAGDLSQGGWFSENWTEAQSVQEAVNSWMGDSAHRGTMLSANLQDIGAGIASDGSFNYYVIDCGLASGSPVQYQPPFGGTIEAGTGTPATQEATIAVVVISTADQYGNVYHVVEGGQTLWQIALAYKTTVDKLKSMNNLSSNSIYIGQKLLVSNSGTATAVPPTARATRDLKTSTPLPTYVMFTATNTDAPTRIPTAPASGSQGMVTAAAIILVALMAAGVVAWVGRRRSD